METRTGSDRSRRRAWINLNGDARPGAAPHCEGSMTRLFDALRRLFGIDQPPAEDEAALRAEFKSRYHHFRQLLVHDREVHERMVDIEEALRGDDPFDMRFVRRVVTGTGTATYQVARHLAALGPGRYDLLRERVKVIQANIHPHIAPRREPGEGPLAIPLSELTREQINLAGPKMSYLGEAAGVLGLRIPDGFVVTAEAYRRFMAHEGLGDEIVRRIQAADVEGAENPEEALFSLSSSLQQLIVAAPLPQDVADAILGGMDAMSAHGGKLRVAMRSSALGEDAEGASFAGQYESRLGISRDEALISYATVVASKYNRQAMSYRMRKGIREEDVAMCVGVMRMIEAEAGGVAYSGDALDPQDDSVSVFSTFGLPKTVVDGAADVDMFRFSRGAPPQLVESVIARKEAYCVCREDEGTCGADVEEERCEQPSLTRGQAREVARLALLLDDYFGVPQDLEWAMEESGAPVLLQARALPRPAVEDAVDDLAEAADDSEPTGRGDGAEASGPQAPPVLAGGTTAAPGKAHGAVFKARTKADLLLFPDGGILVVRQALPSWAPLMHRAAGVVSEMGTVAGHLASIAREFGVPALFGLKGALDGLDDGAEITLDADGGAIHSGRVPALLAGGRRRQSALRGTPVHIALSNASRHILPLNLLDPDGPEFRQRNCRTLHDVLRFCHERAVREMFTYWQGKRFPKAEAKQLFHNGPKQFWVLDLDDGFTHEVEGRFIRLDEIASVPMLALWEGMNHQPWQGPPPINASGFLSVMFQATANTALEPSMATHYTQKNYFMVSRGFASLQSRFGFHFCGAEALVDERSAENYAGFQFRGGAADRSRRVLRARLVADLLEERDFRIRLHGDSLNARVEGFDLPEMEKRLRALGYLVMHTRQLDMIMGDKAEAERRRKELSAEIDVFFEDPAAADDGGAG